MKIKLAKREVVGKKSKTLRDQNLVPANVYGPSRESVNVTLSPKEFRSAFSYAGYNHLVDAEIEGEKDAVKILFKEVQMHPVQDYPIHVSFYQVDMSKPIHTAIPVELEGTSPAVKNNVGLLVSPFDALDIVCLPSDIPGKFVVSIDELREIGDAVHVSDIELPEGVKLDSNVDEKDAVVYIAAPQKTLEEEEAEAEAAAEAEAEAAEGEETEGEEGAEEESTEEGKE